MRAAVTWIVLLLAASADALPRPEVDPVFSGRIFAESSYFNTTANYDTDGGDYVSLGNGRSYKLISSVLGGEFWLYEDLSVFAQVAGARAESNDGTFTRTKTAATDLSGGFRYVFGRTPFPVLAEISLSYPFNRVDENADEVLTGEGTMRIDAALYAEGWIGTFRPYGRIGIFYQDEGRSLPAELLVGAAWNPERFSIGLESYYTKTLANDEYTDNRSRRDTVTTRVDGGSWKFYSVNPEVLGVRAVGDVDIFDQFRLAAVFDYTLNGVASAAGWTALLRLEMQLGNGPSEPEEIRTPKVLDPEPEESNSFQPDQPKYDDSLFQESKPKTVKRPKHKKKTRPQKDRSLEDVQKSLEQ